MTTIDITPIQSKLVLHPEKCPDGWFWTNTSINPYRGCQFDCTYCDGKAHYYRIPNFGHNIRVKENFPKQLERELIKLGYKGKHRYNQKSLATYLPSSSSFQDKEPKKFILSVGGGVTDCYQPIEKTKIVIRKIIKILIDFEIPSFFLTKSTLIKRDIDLIGELNDRCYASVNISVAFSNQNDRLKFEPNSSSTDARFDTLHEFREQRISGGLSMMPILPFICDTDENLTNLLDKAKDVKAEYALIAGLTLKPGNRELFLDTLMKHYPNLIEKYKQIFPEHNTFGMPKKIPDLRNVTKIGHILCKDRKILPRIPRYIPNGCIKENYLLGERIENYIYHDTYIQESLKNSVKMELHKARCHIEKLNTNINEIDKEDLKSIMQLSEKSFSIIKNELNNI